MTTPFSLVGASCHGPLIAAAWDETGLLLAAATGAVLECLGSGPSEGLWHCRPALAAKLPIGNSQPFRGAVALSRAPLRAAIPFPDESAVTLFSHSGEPSELWLPAGEVQGPNPGQGHVHGVLVGCKGAVAKLNLGEGSTEAAACSPRRPREAPLTGCLPLAQWRWLKARRQRTDAGMRFTLANRRYFLRSQGACRIRGCAFSFSVRLRSIISGNECLASSKGHQKSLKC
ncbi:unnamed protein product [Polarella glacialis]|uniref:Uncharacterized protein n=1 Tax=Polarella glacialis TaxID=89957 RepID=A0A813EES1_POLGL|nr:unnamed protein product [Polarella glacialis]